MNKNSYVNPWHKPNGHQGPPIFQNYAPVICEHRGFKVFRLHDRHYDYVFNGRCVTQRAGASKAKEVIDTILAGEDLLTPSPLQA